MDKANTIIFGIMIIGLIIYTIREIKNEKKNNA